MPASAENANQGPTGPKRSITRKMVIGMLAIKSQSSNPNPSSRISSATSSGFSNAYFRANSLASVLEPRLFRERQQGYSEIRTLDRLLPTSDEPRADCLVRLQHWTDRQSMGIRVEYIISWFRKS